MSAFSRRPFQPLDDRLSGKDPAPVLREGVPEGLVPSLHDWLAKVLDEYDFGEELATRVCLRLNIRSSSSHSATLAYGTADARLLEIVDAVLQLHGDWTEADWLERVIPRVEQLEGWLQDAGSIYEVNWNGACLTRRVDATVRSAFDQALSATGHDTEDHLRQAFAEAYGMNPNPDTSYDESVRAVESACCPLVLPAKATQGAATLGMVLGELRNNPKWRLRFPDKDDDHTPTTTIIAMLSSLWEGQVSRHAGGPQNRRQTQDEAEAAVHLAATLVHWATSGVLFQP